jgi:hypothetical protein
MPYNININLIIRDLNLLNNFYAILLKNSFYLFRDNPIEDCYEINKLNSNFDIKNVSYKGDTYDFVRNSLISDIKRLAIYFNQKNGISDVGIFLFIINDILINDSNYFTFTGKLIVSNKIKIINFNIDSNIYLPPEFNINSDFEYLKKTMMIQDILE